MDDVAADLVPEPRTLQVRVAEVEADENTRPVDLIRSRRHPPKPGPGALDGPALAANVVPVTFRSSSRPQTS
jgi:hypothetical protein